MILTRRHALVLLAIAGWNVLSYANFTRNLLEAFASGQDRPAGYWLAHGVLIVVNLAVAVLLARWGLRAWRADAGPGSTVQRSGTPTAAGR